MQALEKLQSIYFKNLLLVDTKKEVRLQYISNQVTGRVQKLDLHVFLLRLMPRVLVELEEGFRTRKIALMEISRYYKRLLIELSLSAYFLYSHCVAYSIYFSVHRKTMAQLNIKKKTMSGSFSAVIPRIKIPRFDNSALLERCSKFLFGCCLNPAKQEVGALFQRFPRIWQMEDHVSGTYLGFGRFQFTFKNKKDMEEILRLGPTHFDGWMVTLDRWILKAPEDYLSTLVLWAIILNIPAEFAAEIVYKAIGDQLGKVLKIDVDDSRILVEINMMKALVLKTVVEFEDGEETLIRIKYDGLQGICSYCNYINHDVSRCKG